MKRRARRTQAQAPVFGWGLVYLIAAAALVQAAETESTVPAQLPAVEQIIIEPHPLAVKPGMALSTRTLVSSPGVIPGAVSWSIETRQHRGTLVCFAVSPDGKRVATGGIDASIHLWNLASGELERVLVGHNYYVYSLSWSPDGRTLASGGTYDATIRLWNAATGMPLVKFDSPKGYVGHVAWSPDGTKLAATGDTSGWVWVWDARKDTDKVVIEVGQPVLSLGWSPDARHLAVSVSQGAVTALDLDDPKANEPVGDPAATHYAVRWSPDGKKLFVGGVSESVIYRMPGAEPLKTLPAMGYTAAWSPDGKQVCSAASSGAATLWDANTGQSVKTFVTPCIDFIWPKHVPLATSSEGSSNGEPASDNPVSDSGVLIARSTDSIAAWRPAEAKLLFSHKLGRTLPPFWTPNKPIVEGVGTDTLTLWDNTTAAKIATLRGHRAQVSTIAWPRDGRTLATASYDGTVRFWDASSGKLLKTCDDHKAPVVALAWSNDGKILASGGYDNKVRLWQGAGQPLAVLEGHAKPVSALAWIQRGNLLASGAHDGKVLLWQVDKGRKQLEIDAGEPVLSLAFSPDGSLLAGGVATHGIRLWQPSNGQLLTKDDERYSTSPRGATSLSWSPNGVGLLVASSYHGAALLWDWQQPKMLHSIATLTGLSYAVFSQGAQMMVAGTTDGMARFWDTSTAELRGVILSEADHLVLISASGNYRIDKAFEPSFVFVLQTETEQEMLSVADFARRYHWTNLPARVKFSGR